MIKFSRDKMTMFIFFGFILAILIAFFISPKGKISSFERRKLEDVPDFSVERVLRGTYQRDLEKSLQDNFFKREFFVAINSYKNLLMGKMDSCGIYKSKNDFLIERPVPKDFNNFSKNINTINAFADKINSKVEVMIVPAAGFILKHNLPSLHEEFFDKEFFDFFEKNKKKNINFLRLDNLFLKEENKDSLFYKTDHHWTSKAAFVTANYYFRQNNMAPLKKECFVVEKHKNFFGTCYSRSGFFLSKPDKIELYNSRDTDNLQVKIKNKTSKGAFFKNFLNEDDKYRVFLGGDYDFAEICNKNVENDQKILIIKDSFSDCLVPFLSSRYKHIYLVDLRFYRESVSRFIGNQNINKVLIIYSLKSIVSDSYINKLR